MNGWMTGKYVQRRLNTPIHYGGTSNQQISFSVPLCLAKYGSPFDKAHRYILLKFCDSQRQVIYELMLMSSSPNS